MVSSNVEKKPSFFFQAEDGIRDVAVTGVQTCALPISSFYFVWLDNSLEPLGEREPPDPRVAGELWAVHGGGVYRARKYRVAPEVLPPTLHWFYWEAYTTWLSGFALLCLLYFLRAEAYLIDPSVLALNKPVAIAIAVAV